MVVDIRGDASWRIGTIERLRAAAPGAAIFAVAQAAEPDLILQAMRAGANEFFTWPPAEDTFHGAVRRTAAHAASRRRARRGRDDAGVLRRQGRRGHDDHRGELRRRARAADQAADGRCRSQGRSRRGRAVSRRAATLHRLDAIDNLHRLDRDFLRELVVKHKSGLEILAGESRRQSTTLAERNRL